LYFRMHHRLPLCTQVLSSGWGLGSNGSCANHCSFVLLLLMFFVILSSSMPSLLFLDVRHVLERELPRSPAVEESLLCIITETFPHPTSFLDALCCVGQKSPEVPHANGVLPLAQQAATE
jgi:hypothetical protein